ncbi:tripartite tricarboxylate transporter TctB family protein [Devosia naphthalenivorans]|jgi:hypothetical protein|uniref:tripartite tricarboxylate transporter TctB family protein n=1 Tax=Devosia naphthalenivorans TaxID=2082392 RepID=UPI000D3454D5|nr:tripartite tricarboxylate transporter TctB family protein [Devosia naphthalenivorans]
MVIKRIHMEILVACLTAIAGVVVAGGSLELGVGWTDSGPDAGYFPFYVGLLLAAAGFANAVWTVIVHRGEAEVFLEQEQAMRLLGFFLPMVAFVAVTLVLGLYVGAALYLFYVAWRQGKYNPLWAAALGISFAVFLFVVFDVLFKVPLLKGPLEAFLKIY